MNNQEQLEPIDFLSEDGHSYSIFTLEDHLNEAKTQNNEIIYTCEATSKKIKSEPKFISLEELRKKYNSLCGNSHKINKKIKKLENLLKTTINKNTFLTEKLYKAKIKIQELEKQKDNPAQTTIIHNLTIYNNKLTSQIQNLQHELIALKRTKPIIVEKNIRAEKKLKRLNNASIELENKKKEIANTLTIRARNAGKAKKSPYEKTGTKEAMKEYWLRAKDNFTERGAKQQFIDDMREKALTNILPMPKNSNLTEKTIRNWMKDFEQEMSKSSS
ncbi:MULTISPECIES: hypothetical protein [unclassified Snodgrassella]|uniref:Calcium binding and coiled-coil domain (CALCOCO1) like n=1 Tax=Snodgrassella alvi SCGC AB-598-J21 TaxID=1385367 RepID=A0A074VYB0_9NEIS|nr:MULTISPECIES: hypothetical protein [Snodgrassella]KEQ00244.1 Calcium binding and coiled-coil domain (CALCOCO1) like [Snodgrassella alvi SCGC AB-598-J21]MBI0133908.1 hypothetical protein [Snodgrassella sp. W8132]MBI0165997.1 hypothetical protein [Snodgrassella sp. M0351]